MKYKCILCADVELGLELESLSDIEYNVEGVFSFRRCPRCGLMMLAPQPVLEEAKSYYPADYHGYHISERSIISFLYRLVYFFRFRDYIKLIGTNGQILDVGCADLPYFDLLKKQHPGLELTGVEFKDEIAEKGRKNGRDIVTGTIMDVNTNKLCDLIIMNNLIEHVADPIKEMGRAYSLLKPGGYILLETPNTKSWDYAVSNRYWGGLHVPRHTYLFSFMSIKLLAKKTGFKVIKTKYLLSTDNWALSVQNYLQSTKRFRCTITNGRTWYYKYLLFTFIPFCAIQLMLQKTGAFVITLQKN